MNILVAVQNRTKMSEKSGVLYVFDDVSLQVLPTRYSGNYNEYSICTKGLKYSPINDRIVETQPGQNLFGDRDIHKIKILVKFGWKTAVPLQNYD